MVVVEEEDCADRVVCYMTPPRFTELSNRDRASNRVLRPDPSLKICNCRARSFSSTKDSALCQSFVSGLVGPSKVKMQSNSNSQLFCSHPTNHALTTASIFAALEIFATELSFISFITVNLFTFDRKENFLRSRPTRSQDKSRASPRNSVLSSRPSTAGPHTLDRAGPPPLHLNWW